MKYLSWIAITSCRQPLKTITRGEWTPSVIVIKNLNYAVNFENDIQPKIQKADKNASDSELPNDNRGEGRNDPK